LIVKKWYYPDPNNKKREENNPRPSLQKELFNLFIILKGLEGYNKKRGN